MNSRLKHFYILITISSILIKVAISQNSACNSGKPLDFNECFSKQGSNSNSKCCYLENYGDQNKKMCLEIPAISYTNSNLYNYNNILYKIICPNVSSRNSLSSCTPIVSSGRSECSEYSTLSESCCFNANDKKCYWLGTKYKGEVSWAGKNLDCAAGFLKENLVKVIAFALFVLFF